MKNHGRLGDIRQTPGYLQKQPCHLPEETGVQLLCAASCDIWCSETWTLTKQAQNKLAAAQTKMERSMVNITYKDQHLGQGEDKSHRYNVHCEKNEMVLGRAYQPPQRQPMDLAGHHLETIDKKRRQGRPAKRWRDDLDKYWSDTIWQRTAQDGNLETAC